LPAFYFYKYTVFRLLAPLVVGILCGNYAYFAGLLIPTAFLWLAVSFFVLILILSYRISRQYTYRWVFGLFVYLFFLVFGACWQNIHLQKTVVDFPLSETVYRVTITDQPEQKENSVLCRARVLEHRDSSLMERMDSPSVLLYFSSDSTVNMIRRGDELLLSTRLAMPTLRGNPDEFNYPRYLIYKGISGTGFVSTGKWQVIANQSQRTIQDYAFDCRQNVLNLYRDLAFESDNFAVLSALTVGYKDELSESIRESFSVSGASHVLALSGLHIGFLYILLFFLLKRIPGSSIGVRAFRVVTIVILLWGFAFLTGLSPSVVRSVIMFSLIGLSQFSSERSVSINTLFVAAIGMLIYNPSWLYDVGFQLSFVAVASILFIQPLLYTKITVRNRVLDKLWGITTVSIAAQVGTAPLVLFYFSRFSVHFLLTNILVIPLVTIIIYVAVAMLVLSFLPLVGQLVAYGLNFLLELLNTTVRVIERLPFASIDRVWIYQVEVILFYVVLFLLGWFVAKRRPRYLIACLSVLLILSVYRVCQVTVDAPQQSLVFYNVRNCPAVHCILPDGRSWLAYADSLPDTHRVTRVASNYWNRFGLSEPVSVVEDYEEEYFVRRNNFVLFGKKRICILNDNRWDNKVANSCLPIDYLYVCKGYTGRIEALTRLFHIRHVVLEPSISDYRRNILLEECERLELPLTSLSDQSSYFKNVI